MKKYIFFVSLLCTFCSCRDDDPAPAPRSDTVAVEIIVQSGEQTPTRVMDEYAVRDVNIYLVSRYGTSDLHFYKSSSMLRFDCMPGAYTLYVIANAHKDMGAMSAEQIETSTFEIDNTDEDLVMSTRQDVTIEAGEGTVILPSVEVRRLAAKIAYRIRVSDTLPDVQLATICFCNVPRRGRAFATESSFPDAKDYTDQQIIRIPPEQASQFTGVFYMPQNVQGTVSGITSQDQKNRDHAPVHATFLMIRAMRGQRVLDYTVYLGENNTDNFDVRRNTSHTLDITLRSDDEADTRVHGYTLEMWDDMGADNLKGYCTVNPQRSLYVSVEGNAHALSFIGELEVTRGVEEYFEFDRTSTGTFHEFEVREPQGNSYYELAYTLPLVTEATSLFDYSVTVTDSYGFDRTYEFSHRLANELLVYLKYGNRENGSGAVLMAGHLCWAPVDNTPNLRVMCYEKGCTLTAKPAAGYDFAGWYGDSRYTRLLSPDETYSYVPQYTSASLFPRFEQQKDSVVVETDLSAAFTCDHAYRVDPDREAYIVPYGSRCTLTAAPSILFTGWYDARDAATRRLLTAERSYAFTATENRIVIPGYRSSVNLSAGGTANSYIAPALGGAYRFNARVMGNGRATTGIEPAALHGASVRVLWETGSVRGSVIAGAELSDGWITFTTGTVYGNALIGLFDAADRCIWSWHVWVAAYDPQSSAQRYPGNRVFMDRNLGAILVSDYSGRGLYYQWGRKDPFPYPASVSSSRQTAVAYCAGYGYNISDPTYGLGERTVAYATANPCTFLCGVYYNDDAYTDIPDWIGPYNHDLWGYATGEKTVYDPCPPGWKVPDGQAFVDAQLNPITRSPSIAYVVGNTSTTATYPMGGYWDEDGFVGNGENALVWTASPARNLGDYRYYAWALTISSRGVEPQNRKSKDKALPIRCVKDQ